jgi:hypothetical protein
MLENLFKRKFEKLFHVEIKKREASRTRSICKLGNDLHVSLFSYSWNEWREAFAGCRNSRQLSPSLQIAIWKDRRAGESSLLVRSRQPTNREVRQTTQVLVRFLHGNVLVLCVSYEFWSQHDHPRKIGYDLANSRTFSVPRMRGDL